MSARYGVILAGGASRRMPGGKPAAVLGGRTLLERAIATVRAAGLEPVVSVRGGTELPGATVPVWTEPHGEWSPHPLRGLAAAVRQAGEPIVVLPVDLPLLPPAVLRALADADGSAVLAADGRPAALVARVDPSLAGPLTSAADAGVPALRTLVDLGATLVDFATAAPDAATHALLNVNDPAALAEAERLIEPPAR